MSWNIGIVQMDCVLGDVEANLARIEAQAKEAVAKGADLVLFPECATTGYFVAERIADLAEADPRAIEPAAAAPRPAYRRPPRHWHDRGRRRHLLRRRRAVHP